MEFPKIRKKITSFLLSEEGKISKQSLLSLGAYVSAAVIGGVLATKEAAAVHTNGLGVSYSSGVAIGSHAHHESGGTGTATTSGCGATTGGCGYTPTTSGTTSGTTVTTCGCAPCGSTSAGTTGCTTGGTGTGTAGS